MTLRSSTERPVTVEVGANIIAGTDSRTIVNYTEIMLNKRRDWDNPLSNGDSAEKIMKNIKKRL